MANCPCCSDILLRHIQHGAPYWFCRSCWTEMPNFAEYDSRVSVSASSQIKPHGVTPTRQSLLTVATPQPPSTLVNPLAIAA